MTLVNLPPVNNGDDANDSLFNSRFAALADVVNGNIDQDNLANGAVTNAKLGAGSVTETKLGLTKVADTSWTVFNFGGYKFYTYKFNVNNVTVQAYSRNSIGTIPFPPGVVNPTSLSVQATWAGNFSGHAVLGLEPVTANGWPSNIGNLWASALTYTGIAHILCMESLQ